MALVLQGHYQSHNSYEEYIEKRQLFLRSYHFSRKKSLTERIRASLFRVKRVMWVRLKSARKIRKLVLSRLRWGFSYRRRRFLRLINYNNSSNNYYKYYHHNNSSCFW